MSAINSSQSSGTKSLFPNPLKKNPLMNNPVMAKIKANKTLFQIVKYIGICGLLILFIVLIKNAIVYSYTQKMRKPWLIRGSKNAKNSLVIEQDPSDPNSATLNRSDNEEHGSEFTYSLWLVIDNLTYRKGKWKHIFHKGNNPPYPNRAPGLWLHPNSNSLRIYMNTYENILEYVDIHNIPIKKWIHLGIVLKEKNLDIYFNGNLKKRHILSSLARQNWGDVWINLYGGFEGYISKFRYYQYAVDFNGIEDIVNDGPSSDTCGGDKDLPGYLNNKWWIKN